MSTQVIPQGTVTFLFSDIEGSTRLWEDHPKLMSVALARHDVLVRQVLEQNGGYVFKTAGDAFNASFNTPGQALQAAIETQIALADEPWPAPIVMRVRIALHTGAAEIRNDDYFGPTLNRVSRLIGAAHGGQILVSQTTQELLQDHPSQSWTFLDLGNHRLRDLSRAEKIFQAQHERLDAEFAPIKTLENPKFPNNLPIQLTSFVGRDREIGDIGRLLDRTNLVTLTGAGGAGKTRLAVQIGAGILERFPDGVWEIELASVPSDGLVGQTVAQVLGVSEQFEQPISQRIVQTLQSKQALLILDNCEHLVDGCRDLVSSLLRGCPNVKVLATSRAPLGIWGEQTYRVPSLSMPDSRRRISAHEAIGFEAVRLLVERAKLVKSEFSLTDQNAPALAKICSRLDGIPLAIELAAARFRSMTAEDIDSRLDDRFRLLTSGDRSALPRQQTLRALIDWSYELLEEPEKNLLMPLSVFAGGWTLTTAEQICTGDQIERWEVLDLLSSLTEKSLVFLDEQHPGRYRLLESVRQYAMERLKATGRADAVHARHRDVFLALAEQAEPELTGAQQEEWLNRLAQEHDNLRAALAWSAQDEDGSEAGLKMSGALHRYWSSRGHLSEGREHLTRALAGQVSGAARPARAGALIGLGRLAWFQGDYPVAQRSFEEALGLFRELGDKSGAAYALLNLGNVACNQGSFQSAETYNRECLQLYREVGDKIGIANAIGNLGNVASDQGDYDTARPLYAEGLKLQIELDNKIGVAAATYNLGICELYTKNDVRAQSLFEECLRLFRELQHTSGTASSLDTLGILALRRGDIETAHAQFVEGLRLRTEMGDKKGVIQGLEEMAAVCAARGETRRAARLWGAAKTLRESIGIAESSGEVEDRDRQLESLRQSMGEGPFAAAMQEGRSLGLDDAVAEALS